MPPVGADDVIIRTQAGARTGGDGLLTDVGMQVAGDLPGGVHLEGFLLAPADPEHLLVDAQKGRGAFEGGPLAALARRLRGGRPNTCIQGPPFSWPLALYSLPKEMSHIYLTCGSCPAPSRGPPKHLHPGTSFLLAPGTLNLYRGQPRHNRRAAMGGSVTISPRCGRIDRLEPLRSGRPAEYIGKKAIWSTGTRWLREGLSKTGLKILKVNKGNDRDIANFHETPQGRGLIRARRVLRIGHGRISSEGPQKSEMAGDGGPHCRVADVGN